MRVFGHRLSFPLVSLFTVLPAVVYAASPLPTCNDFNGNSLEGWTTQAATATISSPGPSGLASDKFLRGGDQASPPSSRIMAPNVFHGDWSGAIPGQIEFDYMVQEDGLGTTVPVNPNLQIENATGTLRAVFRCHPANEVTEPGGSNPGWHHFVAPIEGAVSGLPANDSGFWQIATGTGDDVADWNNLLADVQEVFFPSDIAASPSQTEDFGIDNFCLRRVRCTDFDDQTVQGWTAQAATVAISSPGPSGLASDYFLRAGDQVSPPSSRIMAPGGFFGDWTTSAPGQIEFDYRVQDDGLGTTAMVSPNLQIENGAGTLRAVFVCHAGTQVTEPGGSNPGWHHFTAPIQTTVSTLPSNGIGAWQISVGTGDDMADWNNLLTDVQLVFFPTDIAGSPSQTEDFGVDNFCFVGLTHDSLSCNDFDDQTVQMWTAQAATVTTGNPGPSGLGTDYFLRAGDQASPPSSLIRAPSSFEGNWMASVPARVEFDYRVQEEGISGSSVSVCPHFQIANASGTLRAVFRCHAATEVSEPAGSNPGWHHFIAPIEFATASLPSNGFGYWMISIGTGDDVADWNNLLTDVQQVFFPTDIASSPSQTEDFGVDNFCYLGSIGFNKAVVTGTIMPAISGWGELLMFVLVLALGAMLIRRRSLPAT